MRELQRGDFDYRLPPELIAQAPLPERSASRLLLLDGRSARWQDHLMSGLPALLQPGDLLVFNDTRVLPARLPARKPTGGRIEILLERALGPGRALVQLRDSKTVRAGMRLLTAGGELCVVARRETFWEIELPEDTHAFFERHGRVPLPPYIRRAPRAEDRERYQSLLARVPGAVAAPTASLHFDAPLLQALAQRGVDSAWLPLHVAAGTFAPVRSEALQRHRLHSESFRVGPQAVQAVAHTRAHGGRVIAVGTTVARALESAALACGARAGGPIEPAQGATDLFIRPGHRFLVIDGLISNFHLPQSSLLMLVAAFCGREAILAAYAHAVRQRYRFFSYGDAMLLWPCAPA